MQPVLWSLHITKDDTSTLPMKQSILFGLLEWLTLVFHANHNANDQHIKCDVEWGTHEFVDSFVKRINTVNNVVCRTMNALYISSRPLSRANGENRSEKAHFNGQC